ncbi:MAG: OsmC family protein [Bacillota bacterium]|uniref:Putative redox protein n=2 Tax=Carboxydocella TaxID=178898 RepID=A0A1T4PZL2_9FIRM|nr:MULTISPECIES: OsmC family protein [Carboxydocella]AVX21244.1 putative redox protein [Carboxydocella thermautotrophica]AVX31676.1 putative redox protein [Carboxydocella thermautotrophica]SJZ96972.1 putative redox protein [Carboxydocella sporoproducens DSM 16521]GAW29290.1 osmotically inducible protein OsmC [Carboxydocella sp. ULO1]GAW30758.1 osmotically inducible protein OsmC [Carboxydocella sp. JDF658]
MKVNIKWQGKMHFLGRGAQEVDIPIDAAPAAGGEGKGASPMELLLMGVAGCTAIDIVSILEKMRLNLQDFVVEVEGERAADHPKVFTEITLVYRVWGEIPEEKLVKAIELSLDKYCSASNTVKGVAKINYRYEINGVV